MLHTPLAQISTLTMTAVAAWSLGAGRWPEKLAALCVAADWAGSILFQDHSPGHHGQPITFALDVCMCAALLAIVVKSRRTWVMWAAACAVLLVLTHVCEMLSADFKQWAYLSVSYVWSLGLVAALAAGMAIEGRKPA